MVGGWWLPTEADEVGEEDDIPSVVNGEVFEADTGEDFKVVSAEAFAEFPAEAFDEVAAEVFEEISAEDDFSE